MKFTELSELGGGFWYYKRGVSRGVQGWLYHMEHKLQDWERAKIERYGNTRIFSGRILSVPERKYDVVFLADRCFTDGEKLQLELRFES